MGVVVVLTIVTAMIATFNWHVAANRRLAQRRQHQLQAASLARSGINLAIFRLLTDPEKYRGETFQLLPHSLVKVEVQKEQGTSGTYRIVSEARYPTDITQNVLHSTTRRVQRYVARGSIFITVFATGEMAKLELLPAPQLLEEGAVEALPPPKPL
jgi:hypothetical protein